MAGISEVWDGLVAEAEEAATEAVDRVRDYVSGVQGEASFDSDDGFTFDLGFGERRVLSWQALAAAVVVGLFVGWVVFR